MKQESPMGKIPKYAGDEKLKDMLAEIKCSMDIYEIRAFILGSVLAVDFVPFDYLMEEMLLFDSPNPAEFKSGEQADLFSREIIALWNEIANEVNEKKVPQLTELPQEPKDPVTLLTGLHIRKQEIDYLLASLCEGSRYDENYLDHETKNALHWLKHCSDIYGSCLDGELNPQDWTELELAHAEYLLFAFEKDWPEKYALLEAGLRRIRVEKIRETKERELPRATERAVKVGRNEICPCGSGKKFKKCCGVMH